MVLVLIVQNAILAYTWRPALARWHILNLLSARPPVLCLCFSVLGPVCHPVLMPSSNVVLQCHECANLISHAFFDEHAPRVLVNNRLLVLHTRCQSLCCKAKCLT